MIFPWILLIVLNGDPLPWAGFQTKAACEQVKNALVLPKGATMSCEKATRT
jgi:hypothetical protein